MSDQWFYEMIMIVWVRMRREGEGREGEGGRPVGDDDDGSVLAEFIQRILNGLFSLGVKRASGLVGYGFGLGSIWMFFPS